MLEGSQGNRNKEARQERLLRPKILQAYLAAKHAEQEHRIYPRKEDISHRGALSPTTDHPLRRTQVLLNGTCHLPPAGTDPRGVKE